MSTTTYEDLVRRVNACTKCTLAQKRNRAVPGEGSLDADVMFVGEAPGYYEDQEGRPFVGRAGNLLTELLDSIGLRREDVYITNMLKCRPPNNRDPLPGEIAACQPYLDEQLETISPKVVVALGRYSFAKFFPNEAIGKARGKPRRWNNLLVYPMYHPAAALRNGRLRAALEEDFRALPGLIRDAGSLPVDQAEEDPRQQLSLFE